VIAIHSLVHPHVGNKFLGITLILSTLISASIGGFWSALIVGIGGLFLLSYLFPPHEQEPVDFVGFTFYFVLTFGVAALGAKLSSARRLAELTAQELKATLLSIGDGVLVTDHEGRIVALNPVAESITGWNAKEALSRPADHIFKIFNEEEKVSIEGFAKQVIRENKTLHLRNHMLLTRKDGKQIPIEDSAAPIRDENGGSAGCVIVFRDVTERKRTEKLLKEQDNRKDIFIATLAHELRNPLAPIVACAETLKFPNLSESQTAQIVTILERQSRQLSILVDDLLDVSRISNNKLQIRKCRVDLKDAVDQAVEASMPFIKNAEHEFVVNVPDQPLAMDADKHRLAQIFSNLLNNAAKYTPKGGAISLEVTRHNSMATVAVTDNGIGISREQFESIFEMFSQVDHPITRATSGLGIGLSLTKHLVELHGGSIKVVSDGPNLGTKFVVQLPLAGD
jgi:PAS domain S-box-containing protein